MDRLDLQLAFVLAYCVAMALHVGLAWSVVERYGRATVLEVRIFVGANLALAAWHALQLVDFLRAAGLLQLARPWISAVTGAQLMLGLLVLAIFFHLFCTFERVYQRPAPSLRAAISKLAHRHHRWLVPTAYLSLVLGAVVYLADTRAAGGTLASIRDVIGPTSSYLFGGTLLGMTFVLFPARRGQERIMVPALGRAGLMASLALTLLGIALWHDAHPTRTALALMPWLHLHSVAFCVFLALVRYEFSFMDRYVEASLRFTSWMLVVLACYYVFNRISFSPDGTGRVATSVGRVGILLVAVGIGPLVGERIARWSDRVLFGRHVDLEGAVNAFSRRLAVSTTLRQLVDGAAEDVRDAVRANQVHVVLGSSERRRRELEEKAREAGEPYRMRIPLGTAKRPAGWMLLGERRNLYPYFTEERRYLRMVAELLGSSVAAIRGIGSPTVGVDATITASDELGRAREQLVELERQLREARTALGELRERLDPDLVLEVLTIAEEVGGRNPESALAILVRLRAVYGYVMAVDEGVVPLAEELDFARDYLALERLRLRNRLDVELRADPALGAQVVPRRLLQPLIENALQHGLARELRLGRVRIHAAERNGLCEILVEDNGRGFAPGFSLHPSGHGLGGLGRVQQWLGRHFGDDARLTVEPGTEPGARVILRIPRRDQRAKDLAQPA